MRPVITAVFQNLNITMNFQVSIHRPVMSHYSSDPALGGSWAPVISATDKNLNIKVNYSKCPCANQRWAITQVTQHWMVHQHLSSRQSFRTLILRWIIQGVHAQPVMSHYSNDPALDGSWAPVIHGHRLEPEHYAKLLQVSMDLFLPMFHWIFVESTLNLV